MRLVTVATHSERYFPYLVESCKRFGARLDVLGWGQKWNGFMMKYDLLREYLNDIPDDEIVCVIDSYDVILLQPLEKLEDAFRKTGSRIAVAADCLQTVVGRYMFGSCNGKMINAGTYIGYAEDLRKMVKDICKMHDCKDNKLDDQKILTSYCIKNDIYIDKEGDMFFLLCSFNKKKIRNTPCLLHAPGNTNIDALLGDLGYDVKDVNRDSIKYLKYMLGHHAKSIVSLILGLVVFIALVWFLMRRFL